MKIIGWAIAEEPKYTRWQRIIGWRPWPWRRDYKRVSIGGDPK